MLQRGHAFSGVETTTTATGLCRALSRFKGATPSQAWRLADAQLTALACAASKGPRLLRRGDMLSGADCPERGDASKGPRLLRRGDVHARVGGARLQGASKGPRLLRRGDIPLPPCPGPRTNSSFKGATPSQAWRPRQSRRRAASRSGFKGATPSQAWRPRQSRRRAASRSGFKGATPSQAWRPTKRPGPAFSVTALQRGHAFSGVETQALTGWHTRRPAGFKGATPSQAWRHFFLSLLERLIVASKGPRLLRRGDLA